MSLIVRQFDSILLTPKLVKTIMHHYQHQSSTFEDIYKPTGFGLYNHLVLGILSASAFSQVIAFMVMPFGLPLAGCDLGFSEDMLLSMNISLYLGMGLGGFVLNSVMDAVGRKRIISISLICIFCSNFSSGFAHSVQMLSICCFALGCGLKVNACCIKVLLGEILHPDKRGFYMIIPDIFWTAGYVISTLAAWLINPYVIAHRKADVRLATWRILFGLSAGLSVMVACVSALIQPSVRFLLLKQKYNEAVGSIKQVYTINKCRHWDTLEIEGNDVKGIIQDYNIETKYEQVTCFAIVLEFLKHWLSRLALMFSKRFFPTTLVLTFMQIPLMFGILSANLWLSKMLYYDKSGCHLNGTDILHLDSSESGNCEVPFDDSLYPKFLLLAISIFLGQVILLYTVDQLGRRIMLIIGYMACGFISILLAFVFKFYAVRFVLSSLFLIAFAILNSTFSIVVVELYPTTIRGTAAGYIHFISCVLFCFTIHYLQAPCQYPFIVVGSFMIAAAVTTFFLREVGGKPMVE